MKKVVTFLLASAILCSLMGCGSNVELDALRKENEDLRALLSTSSPTSPSNVSAQATPIQALTAENVTKVTDLVWTKSYSNTAYYHYDVLITNTYDTPLSFTVESFFYDSAGNVIGKDTRISPPVKSGQSTYVQTYLQDVPYSTATYKITPSKSSLLPIDTSKLNCTLTSGGSDTKLVLNITNNDSLDYSATGAYIVFYNGEEIKNVELVYAYNAEQKLPAGSTEYKDFVYTDLYTHYEIYPFGRVVSN